jgi:integrase
MPPRIDNADPLPLRAAATSTSRGSVTASGRRRYAQQASIIGRSKAMRHTFATWRSRVGQIELSSVARIMGTSVRELEDTYFRWLQRTDEQLRAALDAYDARLLDA